MSHELALVTEEDRQNFQRWLKAEKKRYAATRGMRGPVGLRPQHVRGASRSVAIGRDLRESVPLALAALVLHERREGDALAFLRMWSGPFEDVADDTVALLESERDSLQRLSVFGLWCADDSCGQFIQPVAVRRTSTPTHSFATSAVCGNRRCQRVTVIWEDNDGLWVRTAPELKGWSHPMRPQELYIWVRQTRPRRTRPARLIAV